MQKVLWKSKLKTVKPGLDTEAAIKALKEKVLEPAIEAASKNQEERDAYTAEAVKKGKKTLEYLTVLSEGVTKSTSEEATKKLVLAAKKAASDVKESAETVRKQNETYSELYSADGFRGFDLFDDIEKAGLLTVADHKKVKSALAGVLALRSAIIAEDFRLGAESGRLAEYGKRADILLKATLDAAVTGAKKLLQSMTKKSDFKSEAELLIKETWGDRNSYVRVLIQKHEEKMKNIYPSMEVEQPRNAKIKVLTAAYEAMEKSRKELSGMMRTFRLRYDVLKKTYGEHDWTADLLTRANSSVGVVEERITNINKGTPAVLVDIKNKLTELLEQPQD